MKWVEIYEIKDNSFINLERVNLIETKVYGENVEVKFSFNLDDYATVRYMTKEEWEAFKITYLRTSLFS